jgi:hypothetical protein
MRDLLSGSGSGRNFTRDVAQFRFSCANCAAALLLPTSLIRPYVWLWLAWPGPVAAVILPVAVWGVGYPIYWLQTVSPVGASK